MSTPAGPTVPPAQLTPDQLTVIVACCSSLVLFMVIMSVIYHRDPHCCKVHSYPEAHRDLHAPPQYYSSRQTLVGSLCLDPGGTPEDSYTQDGQLFFVGLPSSYSLPPLDPPLPRLPSYESVRKKDRQRHIHMMIADRFGLNGPAVPEPPPTYEESVRHSVDFPYDFLLPSLDAIEAADATETGGAVGLGEALSLRRDISEGREAFSSPSDGPPFWINSQTER